MLSSEEIIVSILHFIAHSDNVSLSEKSIIKSYIDSQSFLKSKRLKNFYNKKTPQINFETLIATAKSLNEENKLSLMNNIVEIICSDGIISEQEAASVTVICHQLGINPENVFSKVSSMGLDVSSYNNFIQKNINKNDKPNKIGFLAARKRNIEVKENNSDIISENKFCSQCGVQLSDIVKFCPECGNNNKLIK